MNNSKSINEMLECNTDLKRLRDQIARLEEEKNDLELMLEATTYHSDGLEDDLLNRIAAKEGLFKAVSKTIPVPFVISVRDSGDILFSNEHMYRVFGHTPETFACLNDTDLYEHIEDRRFFSELLAEKGLVENLEVRMKKSDGSAFPVSLFSQPIPYRNRDCLLTVIYDLTERKRAEEEKLSLEKQLRQSQKMEAVGTLAGGIAHDFNNILAVIFGHTELSMNMLPPESRVKKNLEKVLAAAYRAKAMVMQLLAFCRKTEQEMKPFRISVIIKELFYLIREIMPANIKATLNVGHANSVIFGNPTQIHQVIMNLCVNARDAMRERGGRLDIVLEEVVADANGNPGIHGLEPGRGYVRVSVTDTGIGMDKCIVDRAFDPFFTTKQPGEGTGMGLAVVHGIIESHKGAVSVDSEPGKGTVFHIFFPIAEAMDDVEEKGLPDKPPEGNETLSPE